MGWLTVHSKTFLQIVVNLLIMSPFEKERAYCFPHVGLSICPSVTLCFWSITEERLDIPSSNSVHTSVWGSWETLLIMGSPGQRSRSPGSNVPKPFPFNNSRMPWPTLRKLGPHIHPGWQRKPIKGQGHWGQICQNCLSNNFENVHSYICATYFEPTIQLYKTSVTNKHFRRHNYTCISCLDF